MNPNAKLHSDEVQQLRTDFTRLSPVEQTHYVMSFANLCGVIYGVDNPTVFEWFLHRGERFRFNSACHYLILMRHKSMVMAYA